MVMNEGKSVVVKALMGMEGSTIITSRRWLNRGSWARAGGRKPQPPSPHTPIHSPPLSLLSPRLIAVRILKMDSIDK
jgi:hypothetical protein